MSIDQKSPSSGTPESKLKKSQIIKTFHELGLCNIFKTTNDKTLIKAILKIPYKILRAPQKATTVNLHFSTFSPFFTGQSTFNYCLRLNCYNIYAMPLQNQSNYIFRECILVSQNRLQFTFLRTNNCNTWQPSSSTAFPERSFTLIRQRDIDTVYFPFFLFHQCF